MKTFEQAWAQKGYHYGREPLQNVRLGWEMAQREWNSEDMVTQLSAERFAREAMEHVFQRIAEQVGGVPPGDVEGLIGRLEVLVELEHTRDEPAGTVAWLPIETAPKTGGPVLLFNASGIDVGWWSPPGQWLAGDGSMVPTHWAPLPLPPSNLPGHSTPEEK